MRLKTLHTRIHKKPTPERGGREWVWAVQPQAALPTPTPYPWRTAVGSEESSSGETCIVTKRASSSMDAEAWQIESVSFGRFSEESPPFHKLISLCDVVVAHFDTLVMLVCFNDSMGKSGQREERSRLRGIPFPISLNHFLVIDSGMND